MTNADSPIYGKKYDAFLFDMDGTLLNSIASAERVWGRWAQRHGLDVTTFLPMMHGKRGVDTIAQLGLHGVDPIAEAEQVTLDEIDDVEGIVPIPGAVEFVKSLPADKWAIVTSCPRKLALARMHAAGLPQPKFLVTADDVSKGKPSPECYLLGAKRLNVDPKECLVFEDVAAGILAAEGAGCDVVAITATHKHPLNTSHVSIPNYHAISAAIYGTKVGILAASRP